MKYWSVLNKWITYPTEVRLSEQWNSWKRNEQLVIQTINRVVVCIYFKRPNHIFSNYQIDYTIYRIGNS